MKNYLVQVNLNPQNGNDASVYYVSASQAALLVSNAVRRGLPKFVFDVSVAGSVTPIECIVTSIPGAYQVIGKNRGRVEFFEEIPKEEEDLQAS